MSKFREYLKEHLDSGNLRDLSRHGADGGFNGLIYHSELMELYLDCEDEILSLWEDMGCPLPTVENGIHMMVSKLCWGAAEMVAEEVADEMDEEAEDAEA
jgi:hypothetical protein